MHLRNSLHSWSIVSPRAGQQFAHDETIAPEIDIAFADPGPYVYTQYTAATNSTTTTASGSSKGSNAAPVGILLCTWLGDVVDGDVGSTGGESLSLQHAHCMPRGGFRALQPGAHVLTVQVRKPLQTV
jgi:hypothetical protein